jgi:hypothetical protein
LCPQRRPTGDEGAGAPGPPGRREGLREVRGNVANAVMGTTAAQRRRRTTVRSGMLRRRQLHSGEQSRLVEN